MAVITIAKNDQGDQQKYLHEQDVVNVVRYAICRSTVVLYREVYPFVDAAESVANQILFIQQRRHKPLGNRLIHLIVSFDTSGYEDQIGEADIWMMMNDFIDNYFQGCQRLICMHTNTQNHLHIHYIINPVRLADYNLVRFHLIGLMKSMAGYLSTYFGIAVQGVSYYDERGRMRKGMESGKLLYQNKYCKELGLQTGSYID